MPLKLWLPLDGTNENRGISGVTMSGSPASWGNGRTGKCATFNNNTGNCIANTTKEFDYTVEDFSWAIWAKKDYSSITASSMWIFTVGRADAGGRGYGLRAVSSTQVQVWFGTSTWNINCPDNEWHHFAFTRKGTAINIYRDGTLITSATFGGTLPTYSDGNGPGVGCFHYSGNIYPLIGAISDFRIYNHTLSAKEVAELARGLIVHYPLISIGDANPNLLTWTKNYTKATPYVHSSSATDGFKYMGNDSLVTVTPGKTYYIQMKCDHTPRPNHGGSSAVSDSFTFWFYMRIIGTTKGIGSYDSAICFTSSNIFINDPSRNLYVWQWTAPSNAQDVTFRTNTYSDGSTVVTMNFWDFKLEEGTYTAYVPSRNAAQYSTLGYNSTVVRDASGRGVDLTYSATGYTHVQGSPRYSTAVDFNQTAYLYNDSVPYTLTSFTVSFWLNPRTNASSQHFIFGSFDSWPNNGVGMYRDTNKQTYSLIVRSDAESTYCSCGDHRYTLNAWTFFTLTWDGTTVKVYQNAELKTTKTYGLSGNCLFKNIYLGNSRFNSHPASETEEAAMSDFRLYATALTAGQIKELYNAPISVANTGACLSEQFTEGAAGISFAKTGVVSCNGISSLPGKYDPEVLIEPDGSCWVHIGHHADPTTYKFSSGDPFATGVWKDGRRFLDASYCNLVDKWEFIVTQRATATATEQRFRWVQTKNPNVAVYEDVVASAVTKYTAADGYTDMSASYGGIYKFNSNTYYVMTNGTKGNWFGAIGAWNAWNEGIPGINSTAVKDGGHLDLYIRIDNVTFASSRAGCSLDKGGNGILSPEFVEQ